jgi:hypothetical protein
VWVKETQETPSRRVGAQKQRELTARQGAPSEERRKKKIVKNRSMPTFSRLRVGIAGSTLDILFGPTVSGPAGGTGGRGRACYRGGGADRGRGHGGCGRAGLGRCERQSPPPGQRTRLLGPAPVARACVLPQQCVCHSVYVCGTVCLGE